MFKRLRKYWERQKIFREIGSFDEAGLVYACEEGNLECLGILIDSGVNVNAVSERGVPAMSRSVDKGNLPAIRILIEAGADPNARDSKGCTPLMYSIRSSNRHIFTFLMTQDPDLELADFSGETALFKAVKEGNTTLTRKLIEAGAEVDVINQDGITPLMVAVKHERIGVVKALLSAGADPTIKNKQGRSVLEFDVQSPRLMRMLRKAHLDLKHEEQRLNGNGQGQTKDGRTDPIYLPEISSTLLDTFPNLGGTLANLLNTTLQVFNSPYRADDVEQHGRELIRRFMRGENRANGNGNGHHPVDEGVKEQLSELMTWLKDQETQRSSSSETSDTEQVQLDRALLEAAALGAHRIVPILLRLGADPMARDALGNTPLHLAIAHPAVVKQLLKAKANPQAQNQQGKTPIHLAKEYEHPASLEILVPNSQSSSSSK